LENAFSAQAMSPSLLKQLPLAEAMTIESALLMI